MAKKVVGYIKLQVPAGKANPSPPIGPALGQRGLNIMEFCKAFNAQTQKVEPGLPIPVVITALRRQELHVHHEDSAGHRAHHEGREGREGQPEAAYRQGRQAHSRSRPRKSRKPRCPTSPPPTWTPRCARSRAAPAAWASPSKE